MRKERVETMAKEKKQNNIVRNMMIALVGGLVVGLGFMLLKQQMSEGTWNVINALLFQDITADQGFHSIGLFYIIGQLFMRGLQMAIVPLVLVSLSLAMCSISSSSKLGRIAGRTLLGFFCFYVVGALIAGIVAFAMKTAGFFNVKLPAEAVTEAATLDQFNPLATIVTAVPSNIGTAFSSNNSILAVVVVAIVLGLCMNALGDKMKPLKSVLENLSDIINLYLTFLINKVGPVAIFCLISRTFAIYGAEYLAPAAAYIVGAMLTLFVLVVTIYPIGIGLTTGLSPMKFLKKIAKVGVFGFSTNSSAACLPLNTRTCLDELGCSQEITSFVLPTGMTINMNGTMRKEYQRRKDYVVKALNEIDGISCNNPHGAFYIFVNIKSLGMTSMEVAEYLLDNAKIALVPGSAFGSEGEGYLRISYACSYEDLQEACARIKKAVEELKNK